MKIIILKERDKVSNCQAQAPAELSCISASAPPPPPPLPGKVFKAQFKPKLKPQMAELNLSASLG